MIYLVNLTISDYVKKKNKWYKTNINFRLPKIKEWIDKNNPGDLMIPFSADFESQLSMLESKEDKNAL